MKDPYAMFNTHILSVKGLMSDERHMYKTRIDIRCTVDDRGETLSLTGDDTQIAVKVKDIERIIKEARESWERGKVS